ncbi:hypothetical protein MMC16_002103 [Acarospora aff. strigata]|nr:hypothetical protein [Acarospora aff. strigata]
MVSNAGATPIQLAKPVVSKESEEAIRILETFGMPGYQPWQPTPDQGAAANAGNSSASNLTATDQKSLRDQRAPSFSGPSASGSVPYANYPFGAYPAPSFQANVSIGIQQPPYTTHGMGSHNPASVPYTAAAFTASATTLPSRPKYSYESTSHMNGSAWVPPPPMSPPPPYTPSHSSTQGPVHFQPFPEKSQFAPASYFSPSTASAPGQPPTPPVTSPLATDRQRSFSPTNMSGSQPSVPIQPQGIVSSPQAMSPQHEQPTPIFHPPSPTPPTSSPTYTPTSHVAPLAQRPVMNTNYTYGPPATGHGTQHMHSSPPTVQISPPHTGLPTQQYPPPMSFPTSPDLRPQTANPYNSSSNYGAPTLSPSYDQNSQQAASPKYLSDNYTPTHQHWQVHQRSGSMFETSASHLYFAPPPTTATVQKKKSWQNLGGILKWMVDSHRAAGYGPYEDPDRLCTSPLYPLIDGHVQSAFSRYGDLSRASK